LLCQKRCVMYSNDVLIYSYCRIDYVCFILVFSRRLFKPDPTRGRVDQTRRWQDHHRLLHVTTDVAAALSWQQMDRRRLQLQPPYVLIFACVIPFTTNSRPTITCHDLSLHIDSIVLITCVIQRVAVSNERMNLCVSSFYITLLCNYSVNHVATFHEILCVFIWYAFYVCCVRL